MIKKIRVVERSPGKIIWRNISVGTLLYFMHHFSGLAADVGALQQLPKVIGGASLARELCLTARKFFSDEAKDSGFVNRVFNDKEE